MADERSALDIARLVTDHHQAVYAYAFRLVAEVAEAEDLTQETFLIAQQHLDQLREANKARSWLLTIVRRRFLKRLRKPRPESAVDCALEMDLIPSDVPAVDAIDQHELQQGLNELPDELRVIVLMFYFEGYLYREIAESLELPIGTVMSRLARAKAHLRKRLTATDPRATHRHEHIAIR